MTGCDLQQIAIERRLHGDLGDAEAAALDAHLQTCAACRDYLLAARGTEAAMNEQVQAVLHEVDWERVRRSAARHRAFWREDFISNAAAVAGAALVGWWLVPAEKLQGRWPWLLGAALAAIALTAIIARERSRGLEADADPFELLAAYRIRIRRDLTRWRRQLEIYAILPVVALATIGFPHWPGAAALPYLLGTSAVVGVLAAYDLLVRLPRARRALADLEPRE
jgi:anti-sigma factor RsiW